MIFSKKYVIHIKALKVLHQGLILEKVHRATEFNQQVWLKPYIEMNVELGTKAKNDFETDFFNEQFCVWKNYRKWEHRDIKLVTTDKRRNYLASEPIIQQNASQKISWCWK